MQARYSRGAAGFGGAVTNGMQMDEPIRPAVAEDHAAVDALLRRAFSGPDEALLVHRLRGLKGTREWVIGLAVPLAYAAVSPLVAPSGWLCLAPVAVAPEQTGRGYGTALVREIRRLCLAEGRTLVVLGDPEFYQRAGFSSERAAGLATPYDKGATLIARPGEDVPEARLVYPEVFAGI